MTASFGIAAYPEDAEDGGRLLDLSGCGHVRYKGIDTQRDQDQFCGEIDNPVLRSYSGSRGPWMKNPTSFPIYIREARLGPTL